MQRILIGALSGWQYPERRQRCVTTWFRDIRNYGLDAVFLLGIPGLKHPERQGDMLLLPCPDEYESLPQRTRWFCSWALEQGHWDYLFKCDDDTYICAARLAAYDLSGRDYVGAEWSPGVGYGSGGAGYFLSRRAAEYIAHSLEAPIGAEDLLVGQTLANAGVSLSLEPRLIPFGNNDLRPRSHNDLITVHGVGEDIFQAAHTEVGGSPPLMNKSLGQAPYEFCGRYEGVFQKAEWSIDPRHIYWVHELLMRWPFGRTLEIGTLHGAMTTAFIEASNRGRHMEMHFCDVALTPEFRRVITNCYKPGQTHCHQRMSCEAFRDIGSIDLAVLDGDHRLECTKMEIEWLLARQTTCIIAHDTNSQNLGLSGCEGSAYLKRAAQAQPGYYVLEDNAMRPGEMTQRGMFLATNNLQLLELARLCYRHWCAEDVHGA